VKTIDETALTIFAHGEALRVLERFCKSSHLLQANVLDDDLPSIFGISTVNFGDETNVPLAESEVALGESS
jgi:hypothetical protein